MSELLNVAAVIVGLCVAASGAAAWAFSHDRRLSVLETQRAHLAEWLGRIEAKVDRLVEQRPS